MADFTPDFAGLNSFLTPNDKFYVRNHFASPQLVRFCQEIGFDNLIKNVPVKGSGEALTFDPGATGRFDVSSA